MYHVYFIYLISILLSKYFCIDCSAIQVLTVFDKNKVQNMKVEKTLFIARSLNNQITKFVLLWNFNKRVL